MIDLSEQSSLEILAKLPIWNSNEVLLSTEGAGDSNMNLVLRIATNQRNVILKQSKAYVRKFPQIPAPIDRIEVEKTFYEVMGTDPVLASFSPRVHGFDAVNHILLTEDLGRASDFMPSYKSQIVYSESTVAQLASYLNALHSLNVPNFPNNDQMKALNHIHIFNFPFEEENGFDLDTIQMGLQSVSLKFKRDRNLKNVISTLGAQYLASGTTLLHGDFYPASWLRVGEKIKIIDPEFGFMGEKEFDLGVLFAHFKLSKQPDSTRSKFLSTYSQPFSESKANHYEAIEIMRRLIGIAQLPVKLSLEEKTALLDASAAQLLTS